MQCNVTWSFEGFGLSAFTVLTIFFFLMEGRERKSDINRSYWLLPLRSFILSLFQTVIYLCLFRLCTPEQRLSPCA